MAVYWNSYICLISCVDCLCSFKYVISLDTVNSRKYLQQNDEGDDQGAGAPVGQAVDFLTESFQRIVQQLRSQRDQDGDDNQDPDTNQDDPS